jgi:hypothetical protein
MKRLGKIQITPAIKEAVKKKSKEIKWHFRSHEQAQMVALAELGQSNAVIRRDCKLSDNEIVYGLMKSQKLQGMKGGYRRAWANGESDICKQVKNDLLGILRQEVQRTLPQKAVIEKPNQQKT